DEQYDVVATVLVADQVLEHVLGEPLGVARPRGDRRAQPLEALVERSSSPLDQPVAVEDEHGAVRELRDRLPVPGRDPGAERDAASALQVLDAAVECR